MNKKKSERPTIYQEGEPNFWLEIRRSQEQEFWRKARSVRECLELLEREPGDMTFELRALYKGARLGSGTYQRRGEAPFTFEIMTEDEALKGLFEQAATAYQQQALWNLKAQERHQCAFPNCQKIATGNDVAREITIIDDRGGEPLSLIYYGCEEDFDYIANASLSLSLIHKAASRSFPLMPIQIDPEPREHTRMYLPERQQARAFETLAQRQRREQREEKIQVWFQEAYEAGKQRSALFSEKNNAFLVYKKANSDFSSLFLPDARRKQIITQDTSNLVNGWLQHYLEGVLDLEFGSLETRPEFYDLLYPKLGRVKRQDPQ